MPDVWDADREEMLPEGFIDGIVRKNHEQQRRRRFVYDFMNAYAAVSDETTRSLGIPREFLRFETVDQSRVRR